MLDNIENELAVTVDKVAHCLAYLAIKDVYEPSTTTTTLMELLINEKSKAFAVAFKSNNGPIYRIARIGRHQNYAGKADEVNRIFNEHSESLYLLIDDIVKNEWRGSWLIFINSIPQKIIDRKYFLEINAYYEQKEYDLDGNLTLQDFIDLIEGKVVNDVSLILDVKVELIRRISKSIDNAFYNMHGFHYYKIFKEGFVENINPPFPLLDIVYR